MANDLARANLLAHIAAERRQDPEAIMAPLSAHPRYVIQNTVFDGRDAIRGMYERALPSLTNENMDEYLRALDDPRVCRWGDRHCVIEYSDDYPLHVNMVVVVHFDDEGKILSENTYWRGPNRLAIPVPEVI